MSVKVKLLQMNTLAPTTEPTKSSNFMTTKEKPNKKTKTLIWIS